MEVKSDKLGYLADKISKQSIKGTAWFFLVSYDKSEKDKLKEMLSKKELELEDLENFQPIYIAKYKNSSSDLFQKCG